MIDINKVFVDTSPFIYLIDKQNEFSTLALQMFLKFSNNGAKLITSIFTDIEYKILPKRNQEYNKIELYNTFKDEFCIDTMPINKNICDIVIDIRANNKNIKLIDAFQLAIAIEHHCDILVTNDKELTKFRGIKCVTLDNFK